MEDVLAMLDGDAKPFEQKDSKEDKFDYWGDPDVKPVEIDIVALNAKDNSFLISTYVKDGELSDEVAEEIYELAKALSTKGYTFRHTGDVKDELQTKILAIEGIRAESYLPWNKFNPDIKNPKMKKPSPLGYKIAATYHKVFKKLTNGIRTILARNVNSMLGGDCLHPVGFVIAYTEDGAEGLVGKMDYKITGNLTFFLKIAGEANIPVFNMKKKDAVKRLVEYIKTQKD